MNKWIECERIIDWLIDDMFTITIKKVEDRYDAYCIDLGILITHRDLETVRTDIREVITAQLKYAAENDTFNTIHYIYKNETHTHRIKLQELEDENDKIRNELEDKYDHSLRSWCSSKAELKRTIYELKKDVDELKKLKREE